MSIRDAFVETMRGSIREEPRLSLLALDFIQEAKKLSPEEAVADFWRTGKHSDSILSHIFGEPYRQCWSIEEAVGMLYLRTRLDHGDLAIIWVGMLPTGPGRDQEKAGNNLILTNGLEKFNGLFSANFHGGWGDQDGNFSWAGPIHCEVMGDEGRGNHRVQVAPRTIPLEVGSTHISTTLRHLWLGGVARWPYAYPYVFLLIPIRGFNISGANHALAEGITALGPIPEGAYWPVGGVTILNNQPWRNPLESRAHGQE